MFFAFKNVDSRSFFKVKKSMYQIVFPLRFFKNRAILVVAASIIVSKIIVATQAI